MSESFQFRLITPVCELLTASVTEVVLPAFDGECGVLAEHENFVGLLGTGALKLVRDGNDYWYMVSQGLYQVEDGELRVLAECGEEVKSLDTEAVSQELAKVEKQLDGEPFGTPKHSELVIRRDRAKARLDVHRRTSLVN